jgi:hypothetical protein
VKGVVHIKSVQTAMTQVAGATKLLSFDEIAPGNSVRVTDDNMLFVVDLTMVITGKNRDDAGMVIRRLPKEIFS